MSDSQTVTVPAADYTATAQTRPAISSSVRHAVGTEATGPGRSSWSPITRKSLIPSAPSAIAQARSASTRPRSCTSSRPEATAFDRPGGHASAVRQRPDQRHPGMRHSPCAVRMTCTPFSQLAVLTALVPSALRTPEDFPPPYPRQALVIDAP
jgi:hypothetical protein